MLFITKIIRYSDRINAVTFNANVIRKGDRGKTKMP